MKEVENYWTSEFYDSAIRLKNKYNKQEELVHEYTGIRPKEG